MNFDDFMKGISNHGGKKEIGVDDELAALEEEVLGKKKGKKKGKKGKKDSDDGSLSDLSDLSDISDDEETNTKNKQKPGNINDHDLDKEDFKEPNKKAKDKIKSPEMIKATKEPIKSNEIKSKADSDMKSKGNLNKPQVNKKPLEKAVDVYNEVTEKIYHNCDKMSSVSVLQNELVVCDRIIKFKKENEYDNYIAWETKKTLINANITKITSSIEDGAIDLNEYKKLIQKELDYDKKLLGFLPKDKKIQTCEVKQLTERLNERIKIIEKELTEEVEEEEAEEPHNQLTKEETNKSKFLPEAKIEVKPKEEEKKITSSSLNPDKKEASLKPEPKKEIKTKEEPKQQQTTQVKINEKILQIVKDRLEEYKEAIDYFRANNLTTQLEDATSKAKEIAKNQKLIEEVKDKQVKESSLPDHITPEFICGYSNEERIEKYKVILEHYTTQINDIKKKINDLIDKVKGLSKTEISKTEQSKIQERVKKDLEDMKNRKEKMERIMQTFKDNAKNPWRPAPLYSITDEEEKTERINSDIPVNSLLVCLGKTDYTKENLFANLVIESKTEQVKPKQADNYDSKTMLTFTKQEYKHLQKKSLEIQVYRKQ